MALYYVSDNESSFSIEAQNHREAVKQVMGDDYTITEVDNCNMANISCQGARVNKYFLCEKKIYGYSVVLTTKDGNKQEYTNLKAVQMVDTVITLAGESVCKIIKREIPLIYSIVIAHNSDNVIIPLDATPNEDIKVIAKRVADALITILDKEAVLAYLSTIIDINYTPKQYAPNPSIYPSFIDCVNHYTYEVVEYKGYVLITDPNTAVADYTRGICKKEAFANRDFNAIEKGLGCKFDKWFNGYDNDMQDDFRYWLIFNNRYTDEEKGKRYLLAQLALYVINDTKDWHLVMMLLDVTAEEWADFGCGYLPWAASNLLFREQDMLGECYQPNEYDIECIEYYIQNGTFEGYFNQ